MDRLPGGAKCIARNVESKQTKMIYFAEAAVNS
jgi:hypothetical protein